MVKFTKFITVFAWMTLIFVTSRIAAPYDDPLRHKALLEYFTDKSMHLLLFGILSYLIISFLTEYERLKFFYLVFITVCFVYFYGITDEWHQGFVSGRGVSYYDLLFDVIGAFAGVWLFHFYHPQPVKKIMRKTQLKNKSPRNF